LIVSEGDYLGPELNCASTRLSMPGHLSSFNSAASRTLLVAIRSHPHAISHQRECVEGRPVGLPGLNWARYIESRTTVGTQLDLPELPQ
jgi:hypothetical protein